MSLEHIVTCVQIDMSLSLSLSLSFIKNNLSVFNRDQTVDGFFHINLRLLCRYSANHGKSFHKFTKKIFWWSQPKKFDQNVQVIHFNFKVLSNLIWAKFCNKDELKLKFLSIRRLVLPWYSILKTSFLMQFEFLMG